VPTDFYGNPTAEGTNVLFRTLHADGRQSEDNRPVTHLLAWQRIWSGTVSGRTFVAAEADGAFGPQADLREVAGWPVPFSVLIDGAPYLADGQRLFSLRTSTIADRFGNVLPDGTRVSFVVDAPDGQRIIPAVTINGIAEAVMEAPDKPGQVTIRGSVSGVSSQAVTLSLTAGIPAQPLTVRTRVNVGAGTVRIELGPVLGTLNQHVPDGTLVQFSIVNGRLYQTVSGLTEGGYAQTTLRLEGLAPGAYTVIASVGGRTGTGRFAVGGE
jgi:hypothetical protein